MNSIDTRPAVVMVLLMKLLIIVACLGTIRSDQAVQERTADLSDRIERDAMLVPGASSALHKE